jgi:uncharacterized membrane protein
VSSTRDASLETLIGRVLRTGVSVSTVCLAAGLALSIVSAGAGTALLNAGIVVLILTPGARVVLSIVEYAAARDWTFTALTTIVLLELVAGAIAAIAFHKKL